MSTRDNREDQASCADMAFALKKLQDTEIQLRQEIAERQHAEEAMRASELKLQAILDSSGVAISWADENGAIEYLNRKYIELFGYTLEDIPTTGHWFLKAYPDADYRKQVVQTWEDAAAVGRQKDGSIAPMEVTVACKDGGVKYAILTGFWVNNLVIANFTDISERKRAEVEREQYFIFFNTSTDLMGIADPNGSFKKINPAFLKTLGYSEAELLAKPFIEFVHPEDRQPTMDEMARQLQLGFSLNFENRYLCKDGSFRWLSWSANVNYDEGLTYATARDISERKKVDEAFRESEARLRILVQTIPDMVWLKDAQGVYLACNPAFERLFGAKEAAIIGKTDYDFLSRELADYFRNQDLATIADGKVSINEGWVTFAADGSRAMVQTTKTPMRAADGQLIGVLGIARDITELRNLNAILEQRVHDRTAELETAIYDLENFNYSASHDLRIPLRAVDGFSKILLDEYAAKLDDEGRRLLQVVRANTRKMAQLIDDMLAFSRTGRVAMAAAEIDMNALVREVVDELKPTTAGREVRVEINLLPPAMADRALMRRVMLNLLSNAIKFTRPKAATLIEVGARTEDKEIIYYVKDNGVGFDMQYADKLFGVFQRLHGVSEFEGTGIGLAIVKRIITLHGGRVWAESKVNEGATIYFSIPASTLNQKEAS